MNLHTFEDLVRWGWGTTSKHLSMQKKNGSNRILSFVKMRGQKDQKAMEKGAILFRKLRRKLMQNA